MGSVVESTPVAMSSKSLVTNAEYPSSQVMTSQIPIVQSQLPVVQSQLPVVQSQIPMVQSTTSMDIGNSVYDEDYRLGRRILDDFRPSSYKNLNAISSVQGVAVIW